MEQLPAPATDASLAAYAFHELKAEVSLLRRGIERLTDERTSQPDYGPSLEAVSKRLEDVCAWARYLNDKPALKLTPETLGREISAAAASSRQQDQLRLEQATNAMNAVVSRFEAMSARSRSVTEQNRELLHNRIAFAVAGMVLFSILSGAVARSFPASWAVPERMAARTLGKDMWPAGQDMMAKADPGGRRRIVMNDEAARKRQEPHKRP